MDTLFPKVDPSSRKWFVVDAAGKPLGRVANTVARILSGKNKPTWSPHFDCGDHVIVVNAEKVMVTGKKRIQKIYYHYTGYPGGLRETTFDHLNRTLPQRTVEKAVKGMLPQGKLGREMYRKLKVYKGPNHPHQAQNPVSL